MVTAKKKINTMKELSSVLGISRPTLSRYFQDPSKIRASTSQKIKERLETVDYVPNFFATRINRNKKTGIIGVVTPYLNDLFFTKLLESIEISAMQAGYTVISQCSHSEFAIESRAIEILMSMNVDGALVAPLGNQSDPAVHERLRSHLPYVLIDSRPSTMPNVDFVGTNHVQSTGLITEYLCRSGTAPIFLAMPRVNFNALERENAYKAKVIELGFEPEVIGDQAIESDWHFEAHGEAVMAYYFARGAYLNRSILCANDRVAFGALRAANRFCLHLNRESEEGLRIAGHDDNPFSPFTVPALTTVAQDIDAVGKTAVSRLLELIARKGEPMNPKVILLPGNLKLRESA